MDDSFRVRAEKVFGSLPSSTSTTSSLQVQSSPWSVTGDEVERREWRRGTDADSSDRDQTPCSSSFLEDEWGIRASIGLDPTLDYEDEEDEYDKVAAGTEGLGDRLFMNEVTHHGSYLNSHNVLHGSNKDPRANFLAARLRLKEDDAEARNLSSPAASASQVKEQLVKSPEDGGQPKSILKRKDNTSVVKAQKRVRFNPGCVTHCDSEESPEILEDFDMGSSDVNGMDSDNGSGLAPNASGVPDYLVNPSKYTRYSFDTTTEVDEDGNTRACMDYLSQPKSSNTDSRSEMEDASAQLPKSVTFVSKKKTGDGNAVNDINNMKQDNEDDRKQSLNRASFPVGIAAVEVHNEDSAVEEEGSAPNPADFSGCLETPGRKYRTKSMLDESDS
ncbi:PREDICTED: uncharacterized protein LOC103322262 [Prunus mume]|uniref:Uncharacterized protein LOC103322262 n=1 Tax=Prunus mume TaxID=102107 RepID=A0ABM0NBS1_PRUMU|nr:PREDICTED: uncharacterized protein LOC103322262 [Prunus mume]